MTRILWCKCSPQFQTAVYLLRQGPAIPSLQCSKRVECGFKRLEMLFQALDDGWSVYDLFHIIDCSSNVMDRLKIPGRKDQRANVLKLLHDKFSEAFTGDIIDISPVKQEEALHLLEKKTGK